MILQQIGEKCRRRTTSLKKEAIRIRYSKRKAREGKDALRPNAWRFQF